MNNLACPYVKRDFGLSELFEELNIPFQEQIVLINLAKNKSKAGCEKLKSILLYLHENKNLKSGQK